MSRKALRFFLLRRLVELRRTVNQDRWLQCHQRQPCQAANDPKNRESIENQPCHKSIGHGTGRVFSHVILGLPPDLFELLLRVTKAAICNVPGIFGKLLVHLSMNSDVEGRLRVPKSSDLQL